MLLYFLFLPLWIEFRANYMQTKFGVALCIKVSTYADLFASHLYGPVPGVGYGGMNFHSRVGNLSPNSQQLYDVAL
jgi:hypothetical protein